MLFSLPHHPKSWTRESKKGRNRSKRTCMGLLCLAGQTMAGPIFVTCVGVLQKSRLNLYSKHGYIIRLNNLYEKHHYFQLKNTHPVSCYIFVMHNIYDLTSKSLLAPGL